MPKISINLQEDLGLDSGIWGQRWGLLESFHRPGNNIVLVALLGSVVPRVGHQWGKHPKVKKSVDIGYLWLPYLKIKK